MTSVSPTLVISFDFELAWGPFLSWGWSKGAQGKEMLECARWTHDIGIPIILSHLSRNNLSATWATVGLTMLDRLPPVDDLVEVLYPPFFQPWFGVVPRNATEAEAP